MGAAVGVEDVLRVLIGVKVEALVNSASLVSVDRNVVHVGGGLRTDLDGKHGIVPISVTEAREILVTKDDKVQLSVEDPAEVASRVVVHTKEFVHNSIITIGVAETAFNLIVGDGIPSTLVVLASGGIVGAISTAEEADLGTRGNVVNTKSVSGLKAALGTKGGGVRPDVVQAVLTTNNVLGFLVKEEPAKDITVACALFEPGHVNVARVTIGSFTLNGDLTGDKGRERRGSLREQLVQKTNQGARDVA
jgi:hypothetical protein